MKKRKVLSIPFILAAALLPASAEGGTLSFEGGAALEQSYSAKKTQPAERSTRKGLGPDFLNFWKHAHNRYPEGHIDFCKRYKAACDQSTNTPVRVVIDDNTEEALDELAEVSDEINEKYSYEHDHINYGQEDFWEYMYFKKRGDCEDYALTKQKELIRRGWPPSALLLTAVQTGINQSHMVLTVRTTVGDFILDSIKDKSVYVWHQAPPHYEWLLIQSPFSPGIWMHMDSKKPPAQDGEWQPERVRPG